MVVYSNFCKMTDLKTNSVVSMASTIKGTHVIPPVYYRLLHLWMISDLLSSFNE